MKLSITLQAQGCLDMILDADEFQKSGLSRLRQWYGPRVALAIVLGDQLRGGGFDVDRPLGWLDFALRLCATDPSGMPTPQRWEPLTGGDVFDQLLDTGRVRWRPVSLLVA